MPDDVAQIGVLGGSGLYALLEDARSIEVDTPFGAASAPVVVGDVQGRPVAFLPRHGRSHEHPPHRIPYRANLWALRSLGVRQVLEVAAGLPVSREACSCARALGGLDPDPVLP